MAIAVVDRLGSTGIRFEKSSGSFLNELPSALADGYFQTSISALAKIKKVSIIRIALAKTTMNLFILVVWLKPGECLDLFRLLKRTAIQWKRIIDKIRVDILLLSFQQIH